MVLHPNETRRARTCRGARVAGIRAGGRAPPRGGPLGTGAPDQGDRAWRSIRNQAVARLRTHTRQRARGPRRGPQARRHRAASRTRRLGGRGPEPGWLRRRYAAELARRGPEPELPLPLASRAAARRRVLVRPGAALGAGVA